MKTELIRNTYSVGKSLATAVALSAVALFSVVTTSRAAPLFPLPDPLGAHPGFGVNLPPTGPGLLAPGGTLGPTLFADGILSPDVGHWELEFHNPNPFPVAFDLVLMYPGGPTTGGLTLFPGGSMYFDIGYLDAPPEVSPPLWVVTAMAGPAAPIGPGIFIDTDAIESPIPSHGPGPAAIVPAGAGGAFGPLIGTPPVTVTLAVVPEPSSLALVGIGAAGLVGYVLRRRKVV